MPKTETALRSTESYDNYVLMLQRGMSLPEKHERIQQNLDNILKIHLVTWAICKDVHIQGLVLDIQQYHGKYKRQNNPTWGITTLLDGALTRIIKKLEEFRDLPGNNTCSNCSTELHSSSVPMKKCLHLSHQECIEKEDGDICKKCVVKCFLCETSITLSDDSTSLVLTGCFHLFHYSCLAKYKAEERVKRFLSPGAFTLTHKFREGNLVEEVYPCPSCRNSIVIFDR